MPKQSTFNRTLWVQGAALVAACAIAALAFLWLRGWLDGTPRFITIPDQLVTEKTASNESGLANPASVFCIDKGGKIDIVMGRDSGQYGVCTFPDGRQCEEWAMMREECPIGGVAVLSTWDASEMFCAISGGDVWRMNGGLEQSICAFKTVTCSTKEYYETGKCQQERSTDEAQEPK
jgi:putative hemolysin